MKTHFILSIKQDVLMLLEEKKYKDSFAEHREVWKPILGNIVIALTGIGAIIILGQSLYAGRLCLFFEKTKREVLVEETFKAVLGVENLWG